MAKPSAQTDYPCGPKFQAKAVHLSLFQASSSAVLLLEQPEPEPLAA
ncbi:MAG: hypothetical protein ABI866_06100 [Dokdonella sp.]